jgi:hypothetical protein
MEGERTIRWKYLGRTQSDDSPYEQREARILYLIESGDAKSAWPSPQEARNP